MLTEIYIEALLVDEELADQIWDVWDQGKSAILLLLGLGGRLLRLCWKVRFTPQSGPCARITEKGR